MKEEESGGGGAVRAIRRTEVAKENNDLALREAVVPLWIGLTSRSRLTHITRIYIIIIIIIRTSSFQMTENDTKR